MKEIWKFTLKVTDDQSIAMPKGAKILSAQEQYGKPCIWAIVDPDAEEETRKFRIFGTGHPFDLDESSAEFIGTGQCVGLVWHIFSV